MTSFLLRITQKQLNLISHIGNCHVIAHEDKEVRMILSTPVELTLSSSQKVTVRRECGSRRCSHLSDLGSPDIGRGKKKEAK